MPTPHFPKEAAALPTKNPLPVKWSSFLVVHPLPDPPPSSLKCSGTLLVLLELGRLSLTATLGVPAVVARQGRSGTEVSLRVTSWIGASLLDLT